MPKFPKLSVEARTAKGRKVKQLRRQGLIPGNVFGKKITSQSIQFDAKVFAKLYDEVGETGIVTVAIGEKTYPCLVVGQAKDPVTSQILHVDFHNVSLKEKVTATIPLEIIGESAAVKDLGGVLNQVLHELEVEALPTDLPENIEVDISSLAAIGDSIAISDIKIPAELTVALEPEAVIITVAEPAPEEVEEPAEEEATADAEAEAGEKSETAPAEGEGGEEKSEETKEE